jgi:hypothetical protein
MRDAFMRAVLASEGLGLGACANSNDGERFLVFELSLTRLGCWLTVICK